MLASWAEQTSLAGDHDLLCLVPGDFSVGLFSQEPDISEHMKELQLSYSAASDPKSFLGLVSLK